ncbi:MAG: hypothetical protein WEF86_00585 [Gemmatimonadota bacterium]
MAKRQQTFERAARKRKAAQRAKAARKQVKSQQQNQEQTADAAPAPKRTRASERAQG